MDTKHQAIRDAAIRLFSSKGFTETSVQDIAKEAGMAKGTVYKYFDSKQSILMDVIEWNDQRMLQRANDVHFDPNIPPLQRLEQIVQVELEEFSQNGYFIQMLFKNTTNQDHQMNKMVRRVRRRIVNWHRTTLQHTFGERAHIWDLVVTYQGLLKEYLLLSHKEGIQLEYDKIAHAIVQSLNTLVQHPPYDEPLLTPERMSGLYMEMGETTSESIEHRISELFTEIKRDIQKLDLKKQNDFLDALNMLKEEWDGNESREYLLRALLLFLKNDQSLKEKTETLERIMLT